MSAIDILYNPIRYMHDSYYRYMGEQMDAWEVGCWLLFFWIVFALLALLVGHYVSDEVEWANFESVMHLLLWLVSTMCLVFGVFKFI